MDNAKAIEDISKQLALVAAKIGALTNSIEELKEENKELCDTYEQFILDEIAHVQIFALELTRLATGTDEENTDEAFMEGELTSVIGEPEEES